MWALCGPGCCARVCPMLPPESFPAAADTLACCACSLAMFSWSFSRSKNSTSSYRDNCCVFLKMVAVLSGSAILFLGFKIVSLTNVS